MVFISVDHSSFLWVLSYKVLKTLSVPLEISYLAHAQHNGPIKFVFFEHLLAAFLKIFALGFSRFLRAAENLMFKN